MIPRFNENNKASGSIDIVLDDRQPHGDQVFDDIKSTICQNGLLMPIRFIKSYTNTNIFLTITTQVCNDLSISTHFRHKMSTQELLHIRHADKLVNMYNP